MSNNEPENDLTTRTWFVGEDSEEEQAPEDTLIPGEHTSPAAPGNDSLITGDGFNPAPSSSSEEEDESLGKLNHLDNVISGADDNEDDFLKQEESPLPEAEVEPEISDNSDGDIEAPAPQRKSLTERTPKVEEDSSFSEPVTAKEAESTAERRYSLLNGQDNAPAPAKDDSPNWDSVEETEPEEVLTTAQREKSFEDTIFEGATVKPTVPSRAAAHVWSLLLFILLVPVTWYLVLDVATRLRTRGGEMLLPTSALDAGQWLEVAFALIAVFILLLIARFSSLGAFITGLLLTVGGAFFLVVPAKTAAALDPFLTALDNAGQQGHFYQALPSNIAHHLAWSGGSGMLLFAGLALLGIAFLSHSARRAGRKDYLIERKVKAADDSQDNKMTAS